MGLSSATKSVLWPLTHRGIRLFGRYFPTLADFQHHSGLHLRISARRHRKGASPLRMPAPGTVSLPLHFWAPARLGWWIAVLFMIGSLCFAVGAWSASFPASAPALLAAAAVQNGVFFTGSLFFTAAATCQLIESKQALRRTVVSLQTPKVSMVLPQRFATLGYYSSFVQWIGTLLFNLNTLDALIGGSGWLYEDLTVWMPDVIGSVCFLIASHFAYLEIKYDSSGTRLSRAIVSINYLGSVAFMLSAICAVALPFPEPSRVILFASLFTFIGAVCFFVAAYLLIPELSLG